MTVFVGQRVSFSVGRAKLRYAEETDLMKRRSGPDDPGQKAKFDRAIKARVENLKTIKYPHLEKMELEVTAVKNGCATCVVVAHPAFTIRDSYTGVSIVYRKNEITGTEYTFEQGLLC